MSEFSFIYIKTLYYRGFQLYPTVLIRKLLEATGIDHFNWLPTLTKVEAPIGTDENVPEAKRDWSNSYASVIGIMLYLVSNTRPNISFSVHQCFWFTNNSKASNDTDVKSIYWYLQATKGNGLVFNPYRKWWWVVMMMQILRDCGDMKILKTLFLLVLELYLW